MTAKGGKAARAKEQAGSHGPLGALGRLLSGPLRWVVGLGLVVAIVAAGGYALRQHVRQQLIATERYFLHAERIHITPPPEWIKADIRGEVVRLGSLDEPLSLLDDDLAQRVARAFGLHPWVAEVVRVQKRAPADVDVELTYRRPVAMVEVPGGLYPVDLAGVLLPTDDFTPQEAQRYPRIGGIAVLPLGTVGSDWGDPRVRQAAQLGAALGDVWVTWKLDRIVPGPDSSGEPASFELYTRSGTRIVWGHAPGCEAAGTAPAAEKLAWLEAYFTQHATFDGREGPQEIDLRQSGPAAVAPRTAGRP